MNIEQKLEKLKRVAEQMNIGSLTPEQKAKFRAELLKIRETAIQTNRIAYWKPYAWQNRTGDVVRKKSITLAISSNKIGKSTLGVNTIYSWAQGYEPWSPEASGIAAGNGFYRESSLGIKPPVDLIIVGEDWKLHLGKTIVREMKKWYPQNYETKKNEQGVEYYWVFPNRSTITLMCYSQDDDLFESFRAQGVLMDEPPPQSKFSAMSRGLLLDCGKVLMTLTPLKEAWILDELVLSGRSDIGIVDGLNILANEDLAKEEQKTLESMGLSESQIKMYWDLLFYKDTAA